MRTIRSLLLATLLLALCAASARAGDLGIYSFTGPATDSVNTSFSYNLQVMNFGGETATANAKLTVRLDPNVTFSSTVNTQSGWTCTTPTPGQSGTITCTNSSFARTRFWAASETVVLNEVRFPTTPNGHLYKCTTAGTTGSTEPTWPTGPGATVTDGGVVWTEVGADNFWFTAQVSPAATLWSWLNSYATISLTPTTTSLPDPNPENDRMTVSTRVNG
jgi:hypothetical protein